MPAPSSDQDLARTIMEQLDGDDRLEASRIEVVVSGDSVTLKGTVPCHLTRLAAVEGARAVCGDRDVRDQLAIAHPSPSSAPAREALQAAIEGILAWLPDVNIRDRTVRVADGVVSIEGCVDAMWKKAQVSEAIRSQYGVVDLENKLTIVPTGNRSDQDVALDIERALDRHDLVDSVAITVKVERGVVSLSGCVPSDTAKRAVLDAALHTPGVVDIEDGISATDGQAPR
jgi:osmotically-inducible protein OsmY